MEKLTCYAITPRALQIVMGEDSPRARVPEGWFNWVGLAPTQPGAYTPQRLELVRCDGHGEAIARWCANAHTAGYDCALIASIDEDFQLEDVRGLRGDMAFCPVTPSPFDAQEHRLLREMLREPEQAIVACWVAVKVGGGADIDRVGFSGVTPAQWWAYGQGLRDWSVRTAKGQAEAHLREKTPDFSRWAWLEGVPALQLDLQWCWNGTQEGVWPWSVDNPCTSREIPALDALDLVAYWPIRQMPCCGVALHKDRRLMAVGALTDDWAWDASGLIRAAMMRIGASTGKPWADRKRVAPVTDDRDLLRKLLDFFKHTPSTIEVEAATEQKTPVISAPPRPSFIYWEESLDDCIVRARLLVDDEDVVLELNGSLPAGASPVAIRLRKSGSQWPVEVRGKRWVVDGLERQAVDDICRRYCADGRGGQRFVRDGYELVLSRGDEAC